MVQESQIRLKLRKHFLGLQTLPIKVAEKGIIFNLFESSFSKSFVLVQIEQPEDQISQFRVFAFFEFDSEIQVHHLVSYFLSGVSIEWSLTFSKLVQNYSQGKVVALVRMVLMEQNLRRNIPRGPRGIFRVLQRVHLAYAEISNS